MTETIWKIKDRPCAVLRGQPLIMGIVNVTPDSFSDGGSHFGVDRAIAHGLKLIEEGADILDIGGESTRPGAQPVSAADEWLRIGEVIRDLASAGHAVSVDTMKPEIMEKAVQAGAVILNDVNGFRADGAAEILAQSGAAGVVMHMKGEPGTMQIQPEYDCVVSEVTAFLESRLENLVASGVNLSSLLVDPGFGFGKTLEHNLQLMQAVEGFASMGSGVLVGVSRKRMIAEITGRQVATERVFGSVGAALFAARQGAAVLRVHDVQATRDALCVQRALESGHLQID